MRKLSFLCVLNVTSHLNPPNNHCFVNFHLFKLPQAGSGNEAV